MNLDLGLYNFQNWKENWKPLFQSLHFHFLFWLGNPRTREKWLLHGHTDILSAALHLTPEAVSPLPFFLSGSCFCTAQLVPLTPWLTPSRRFLWTAVCLRRESLVSLQESWGVCVQSCPPFDLLLYSRDLVKIRKIFVVLTRLSVSEPWSSEWGWQGAVPGAHRTAL